MLRRRTSQELPLTSPSSCNNNYGYSHGKYSKKSKSTGPLSLILTLCIIFTVLYGFSRLTSSSSGSDSRNQPLLFDMDDDVIHKTNNHLNGIKNNNNEKDDELSYYYGHDTNEHCDDWAQKGECMRNRPFMLSNCPYSCHTIAKLSIDNLSKEIEWEDMKKGIAYFRYAGDKNKSGVEECQDLREDCNSLAIDGKCLEDAEVRNSCRKSCLVCFGSKPSSFTINFGVEQEIEQHSDNIDPQKIKDVIKSTHDYMINDVFAKAEYEEARHDCRNYDPDCSFYAAKGECHGGTDAMGMQQNCAPACHACHGLEYWRRCMKRPEDIDALEPGGISELFERIVKDYTQYNPTIISKPDFSKKEIWDKLDDDDADGAWEDPWIVTLDDFLTPEECDWFIAKGYEVGWEDTAEISNEIEEDGTYGTVKGQGRSSKHVWCDEDGCGDQPTVQGVIKRVLDMVQKFPQEYLEALEILKYEEGGRYEPHHDIIPTHVNERCGARILTMYLFFSDVEEGGEIHFSEMDGDVRVHPKKGRVVLWNNMGDNDFGSLLNNAFHEAMPVLKGKKYGANQWFHMRDISNAYDHGCCGGD